MELKPEDAVDMNTWKKALSSAKNIVVIAGAGLSAASGIPTFRGNGGLWRSFDAMSLATPEAFAENPSRVWEFYHYRREIARAALPNSAHLALALLQMEETRKSVAPSSKSFALITQNVDGLSPRALASIQETSPLSSGSSQLLEMHGSLFRTRCTSCGKISVDTNSPICPALGGREKHVLADDGVTIPVQDLPHCDDCDGLLRPDVVWFGERPYFLDQIEELVSRADLCLVVGTSSQVHPAASYAFDVESNGGTVAVFNVEKSKGDPDDVLYFLGPCEETLPKALGLVNV